MIRWPRSFTETVDRATARLNAMARNAFVYRYGPVEYADKGEGPAVLVSHGIFGGFDAALGHADSYLGDGFRVIGPSRFGYLGSPMPLGVGPEDQADAFAELLDHLGIERVAVLGFSAGSTAAIHFTLRHRARTTALVIVCGHYPQRHIRIPPLVLQPIYTDRFFWGLQRFAPRRLWNFVAGLPENYDLSPSDEATIRWIVEMLFPISAKREGAAFDTLVSNPSIDFVELEDIAVPTLMVHAADDQLAAYVTAQRAAERISGVRLITILRGAHLLLGSEERVRDAVSAFVAMRAPRLDLQRAGA